MKTGMVFLLAWLIWPAVARENDQPLSLAFDNAPVSDVLQALAEYQQLNLVIAPGVEGRLSLRLQAVPWRQALTLVARMSQLVIETEGNVLMVFPHSWQREQQQRQQDVRAKAQQNQPLGNLTLVLHYADAAAIRENLLAERENLMSPRGSVIVDTRTNALLIRDTSAAQEEVARWVKALDVPLEQVELAAHIVTIGEEHLRELGVNWATGGAEQINQALRNPHFGVDLAVNNPAMTAGFTLGRLDGRLLDLELSALEREDQVEIIASPRLFTSHQQPASIKQGTEIPYEVANGSNGATRIEFREAVLGMEVTPSVQPNGRILLKLHLSQNVPGRTLRHGDSEVLTIDKQEIDTQVTLKDGQTLALGGIFQQQKSQGRNAVPLLGKIPLLGALFRHQIDERKRRELVIFITPRLIRDP
ncbi:protein transport protein HofQ [Paramixta manurensis]|uniref:Protein transport protein HofQ n=1 Tax=Paramixta manurensis TaxID=2740817 RepID=A0A6M8U700_9GAMM|nr:protein transport protein HofQ [Erwiniaceae bacterium PD-1]